MHRSRHTGLLRAATSLEASRSAPLAAGVHQLLGRQLVLRESLGWRGAGGPGRVWTGPRRGCECSSPQRRSWTAGPSRGGRSAAGRGGLTAQRSFPSARPHVQHAEQQLLATGRRRSGAGAAHGGQQRRVRAAEGLRELARLRAWQRAHGCLSLCRLKDRSRSEPLCAGGSPGRCESVSQFVLCPSWLQQPLAWLARAARRLGPPPANAPRRPARGVRTGSSPNASCARKGALPLRPSA
jgi:hypothetical protein